MPEAKRTLIIDRINKLTCVFDFFDVVTGKPSRPAVQRPLPPSAIYLLSDCDHITFAKYQFIWLIATLEIKSCSGLLGSSTGSHGNSIHLPRWTIQRVEPCVYCTFLFFKRLDWETNPQIVSKSCNQKPSIRPYW